MVVVEPTGAATASATELGAMAKQVEGREAI